MCTHACQAAPPADGAPAPAAEKKADAPKAEEKKADAPAGDEAPKPKKKKKAAAPLADGAAPAPAGQGGDASADAPKPKKKKAAAPAADDTTQKSSAKKSGPIDAAERSKREAKAKSALEKVVSYFVSYCCQLQSPRGI